MYVCVCGVVRLRTTQTVNYGFFSIPFKPILDQISGEKQLKLSLAEFVYVLAAVKFCRGMRQ